MVFAGLYPAVSEDFGNLRDALEKLQLNDSSSSTSPRRRRPGVRFPLRVPWNAPHGSGAGEAGEAPQPQPRHHRPPSSTASRSRTAPGQRGQPRSDAVLGRGPRGSGTLRARHHPGADAYLGGLLGLLTERRAPRGRSTTLKTGGSSSSTTCRCPRSSTTSTTSSRRRAAGTLP